MIRKFLFLSFLVVCLYVHADNRDYIRRGDSCMAHYDLYGALSLYTQAFETEDTYGVRKRLAECYYRRADYRRMLAIIRPIPDDSLGHELMRQLFYAEKRLSEPQAQIYWGRQILHRYPMDAEIIADLAQAYTMNDQPQNAMMLTLKYLDVDSANVMVERQYADACFLLKSYVLARDSYLHLLALGDSTYNCFYSLGMCCEQLKKPEEALAAFSKAIALTDSAKAGPLYHQGCVYVTLGKGAEAISCLQKALQILQPDPSVLFIVHRNLGDGYLLQDDWPQAIQAWTDAVSYNPYSLTTWFYLGAAYHRQSNRQQAARCLTRFIDLASAEKDPNADLKEMIRKAKVMLQSGQTRSR
ncbi:MAG: hypothetical protein MR450_13670 [Prevotella sp.]|nr:hypothetical protein [Prevotella sp.]